MTKPTSATRSTAVSLVSFVLSGAVTACLTIFLVRSLGPSEYGIFALALSVGTLAAFVGDWGLTPATARFVAERRGDRAGSMAVIATAVWAKVALASGSALLLVVLAAPIERAYDAPGLAWAVRTIALVVIGQGFVSLFTTVLAALDRPTTRLAVVAGESASEALASVALVVAFGGATAAAAGRATGFLAGGAVGAVLVWWSVRGPSRPAARFRGRELAGYAKALLIVDGAFLLFDRIDVLLIGALLDEAAVGAFDAPLRIIVVAEYLGWAVTLAVAPRMAGRPEARDTLLLERSLAWLAVFYVGVTAVLAAWAAPIVAVALGDEYGESVLVLRVLASVTLLIGLAQLVSGAINYAGHGRRRVPIAIACLLLNAALDLMLIPRMGIVAGALATNVALFCYLAAHLVLAQRTLGLSLRPLASSLWRGLVAGAVMTLGLLALQHDGLGLIEALIGLPVMAGGYLAALWAMREPAVRQSLRALAAGLRR